MIIHELDDDGVGLGSKVIGTTRCGAMGEMLLRAGRRHIRTNSGALFALSRLTARGVDADRRLELEPTTCAHCLRRGKRRHSRASSRAP